MCSWVFCNCTNSYAPNCTHKKNFTASLHSLYCDITLGQVYYIELPTNQIVALQAPPRTDSSYRERSAHQPIASKMEQVSTGSSVLISYADGTPFTSANPFSIAAHIRQLIGEVQSAKPTGSGLLVKTLSSLQTETLICLRDFMGRPAAACMDQQFNYVEAYAHAPALLNVPRKEIIDELAPQGVIDVRRLRPRGQERNPGLRIRFRGLSLPKQLQIGFDELKIRRWTDSPKLCRRCAEHGHLAVHCRSATTRCLRCSGEHHTDDCQQTKRHCPHCGDAHAAWDRRCPKVREWIGRESAGPPHHKRSTTKDSGTQTKDDPIPTVSAGSQTACSRRNQGCQAEPATRTAQLQASISQATKDQATQADEGSSRPTAPPPPIPPRMTRSAARQQTDYYDDHHDELQNPELFPTSTRRQDDPPDADTRYVFKYSDGTTTSRLVKKLFRYDTPVLVADLDLSERATAGRAARRGYYFDGIQGRRLFLQ